MLPVRPRVWPFPSSLSLAVLSPYVGAFGLCHPLPPHAPYLLPHSPAWRAASAAAWGAWSQETPWAVGMVLPTAAYFRCLCLEASLPALLQAQCWLQSWSLNPAGLQTLLCAFARLPRAFNALQVLGQDTTLCGEHSCLHSSRSRRGAALCGR